MKKFLPLFLAFLILPSVAFAAGGTLGNSNNTSTLTSGLVGYWTFDGSKTSWLTDRTQDSSGQGNTGQLLHMSTTTSPGSGKIAQALIFSTADTGDTSWQSGSGDFVEIPNSSSLSASASLSYSLWVKPKRIDAWQGLISKRSGDNNEFDIEIRFGVDKYLCGSWGGTPGSYAAQSITSVSSTEGKWTHLVCTVDANGNANLYVNGKLEATVGGVQYTSSTNTSPVDIGKRGAFNDGAGFFDGSIDDVRVYSRVLSTAEVKQLYTTGLATVDHSNTTTLQSGLVGYWSLDGNTTNWNIGATIDASGNGNVGQLIKMATSTSPVAGKIGGALNFNGSNSYVKVSGSTLPTGSNPTYTISVWVDAKDNQSGAPYIVDWGNAGRTGDAALLGISGLWRFGVIGGCNVDIGRASDANKWVHLVGTFDGTNARFYRNGVLAAGPIPCSPNITAQTLGIGAQNDGTNVFTGPIDDVRIYNRALSAQEVHELYTNGVTTIDHSITTTASQNGLLGYYTFDGQNTSWNSDKVTDSSGQGNTGQMINMSTSTSPAAGKIGQALKFNGVNSYISVPSAAFNNFPTSAIGVTPNYTFSFSTWFKTSGAGVILGQTDGCAPPTVCSSYVPGIYLDTSGFIRASMFWHGATSAQIVSGSTYNDNIWHHLVDVYNNGVETLYIDNTFIGTQTQNETGYAASYAYYLGTGYTGTWPSTTNSWFYFSGVFDDTRMYGTALSASQVAALYQLGR